MDQGEQSGRQDARPTTPSLLQPTQEATQPPPPDLAPVLDPIVASALDEFGLVGLTIGVRQGQTAPFVKAYGRADASTIYPVASITKQFTAAAVLQLVEAGHLSLDDPILRFFPAAPAPWAQITVHHLLNHTSGLPDLDAAALASLDAIRGNTVEEVVALIEKRSAEPTFAPGSSFAYANASYYLLGAIIEQISGLTYGQYLRQHLFDPLGLGSTEFDLAYPPGMAQGYAWANDGLVPVRPVHPSLNYAVGGVVSTARDLLAWQGALAEGRVVRPDTYRTMISPTTLPSGGEAPYGYGFWIGSSICSNAVHHTGSAPGFASYLLYCPDDDLGLVLLLNNNPAYPEAIESLASRLTSAVVGR
jgi:CubicO group peptidase (beta-lactamase class C family)